jgi:hypothetical protein
LQSLQTRHVHSHTTHLFLDGPLSWPSRETRRRSRRRGKVENIPVMGPEAGDSRPTNSSGTALWWSGARPVRASANEGLPTNVVHQSHAKGGAPQARGGHSGDTWFGEFTTFLTAAATTCLFVFLVYRLRHRLPGHQSRLDNAHSARRRSKCIGVDHGGQNRDLRLRATPRHMCQRSRKDFAVSLLRLPKADRQHLWCSCIFSSRGH